MTDETAARFVYDGDCAFCARWVAWYERKGTRVSCVASHAIDLDAVGLSEGDVRAAAWYLTATGERRRGHAAISAALEALPQRRWRMVGRALRLPLVGAVARVTYGLVARLRHRLPGGTPQCALPSADGSPFEDRGIET